MVKIHGRWCGPNWTDGKNESAASYKAKGGRFKGRVKSPVDRACRTHDKGCATSQGCCRSDDLKLIASITKFQANPFNALRYPSAYLKAPAIKAGIAAAIPFRSC